MKTLFAKQRIYLIQFDFTPLEKQLFGYWLWFHDNILLNGTQFFFWKICLISLFRALKYNSLFLNALNSHSQIHNWWDTTKFCTIQAQLKPFFFRILIAFSLVLKSPKNVNTLNSKHDKFYYTLNGRDTFFSIYPLVNNFL